MMFQIERTFLFVSGVNTFRTIYNPTKIFFSKHFEIIITGKNLRSDLKNQTPKLFLSPRLLSDLMDQCVNLNNYKHDVWGGGYDGG